MAEDWDQMTTAERKAALHRDEKTVFVDDLDEMFLTEDCGGDMNVHLFDGDVVTFASLNPPEVQRLHEALAARVAQYAH